MPTSRSTAPPVRHGRWRPAAARTVAAATLALGLPLAGWVMPAAAAPAVVFDYTITGGPLAGVPGSGRSAVTIIPGPDGNTFNEQGRFEFGDRTPVPLPATPALAAVALLLAALAGRRRPTPRGDPRRAEA